VGVSESVRVKVIVKESVLSYSKPSSATVKSAVYVVPEPAKFERAQLPATPPEFKVRGGVGRGLGARTMFI
jgi:hypothetical protein